MASPVPPAGGSQGTGQDLSVGGPDPGPPGQPCLLRGQRRLRLRFTKAGKIRFTSHRDVARMWERALRRSRLPAGLLPGVRPPPPGQLRAGPAHRAASPLGEYLDVRLDAAGPGEIPVDGAARPR